MKVILSESNFKYKKACRKFTLIELLVVVAIFGILVSLLMPALNKVREQTRRSVCMSNLQQIGVSQTTYANEYDGYLVLGTLTTFQNNYWFWVHTEGYLGWGLYYPLYDAGLVNSPEVWYCPSNTLTGMQFNSDINKWAPKERNAGFRAGYSSRSTFKVLGGKRTVDGWYYGIPPNSVKLMQMESQVIMTDPVVSPGSTSRRHLDGVNALNVDISVSWKQRGRFKSVQDTLIRGPWTSANNSKMEQIYELMDD
jgi:prepilin-type N-terminal cleavage/methylation domain-containing protein